MLLIATACDYTDTSSLGEDDTARAAIADPQVNAPKFPRDPLDCESVLAVHSVSVVAGAPSTVGAAAPEECRTEFGSWLVVRVDVEGDRPTACNVGGQLLIVAFSNLPGA